MLGIGQSYHAECPRRWIGQFDRATNNFGAVTAAEGGISQPAAIGGKVRSH